MKRMFDVKNKEKNAGKIKAWLEQHQRVADDGLVLEYQERLNKIPFMNQLWEDEAYFSYTIEMIDYIEQFYQLSDVSPKSIEVLESDVLDIYLFVKMRNAFASHSDSNGKNFREAAMTYMKYANALACSMYKNQDEEIIFDISVSTDKSYKQFFCDTYNPDDKIFNNEDTFNLFRFGFHGTKELLNIAQKDGSTVYTFKPFFLLHLYVMHPRKLINGRREEQFKLVEENYPELSTSVERVTYSISPS